MGRQRRNNTNPPEAPETPKVQETPEVQEAPEMLTVIVKKEYSCEINGRVFDVKPGDKIEVTEYELGRLRKVEVV